MEVERKPMAPVVNSRMVATEQIQDDRGFSLVELMVAMVVLTVGLMPLLQLTAASVVRVGSSTPMLLAREKAREAIESVHAARDTGEASWATIRNLADGGVFLNGAQPIRNPGNDGLVNTADDGAIEIPAAMFTREIDINPLNLDGQPTVNPNLREVRVVINYWLAGAWRTYVMTTYISAYS
jgi:prepilin-type N-terminal cleavage/methylation domain-containing protein